MKKQVTPRVSVRIKDEVTLKAFKKYRYSLYIIAIADGITILGTQTNKGTFPNYLTKLTDWIPSATIRKRQKKLIADEMAEIFEFEAQGRMHLARWRRAWLWVHWTHYLVSSPAAWAMKVFKKTSSG